MLFVLSICYLCKVISCPVRILLKERFEDTGVIWSSHFFFIFRNRFLWFNFETVLHKNFISHYFPCFVLCLCPRHLFLCKYKVYIVIIHNKCRAADLNLSNHIISLSVPVHVVLSLVILLPIYFIYQAQASYQ